MKVKRVLRKIASVAAGAAMLGATVTGALAVSDLGEWPAPFVVNGQWNGGYIVIGANAKSIDTIAAIDIAQYLQTQAVTRVPIEGGETITVENGVLIEGSGSHLNLGDTFNATKENFKAEDFPILLEDGTVKDSHYEDEDYDYTQKIILGNPAIQFGRPESDWEKPTLYVDLKGSDYAYEYEVKFDEPLKANTGLVANEKHDGLADSEKITMLGKKYTFDSTIKDGENLVLYGSEQVIVVNQGEEKEINIDGDSYTIQVLGGNSDAQTAWLNINGESESVTEGEDTEIGGLQIHVDDVFISNVGGDSVAVKLFIGSQKLEIPADAIGNWAEVKVNGDTIDGVEVKVDEKTSDHDWDDIEKITFRVSPDDFVNDVEYLKIGEEVIDPIFGIKLKFAGVSPALDSENKVYVEMKRAGNELEITFTNEDGNSVSFEPYTYDSDTGDLTYGPDFGVFSAGDHIEKGDIFILEEGTGTPKITKIYELRSVTSDGATLKELTTGREIEDLKSGDEIEDTGVEISDLNASADWINLTADTKGYLYTKDGLKVSLGEPNTTTDTATITISEDDWSRVVDETSSTSFTIDLKYDSEDNRLELGNVSGVTTKSDKDNNVDYILTALGTYGELDTDNDGEYLKLWYPTESLGEMKFNVYIGSENAVEQESSTNYREVVNPIPVGVSIEDTNAPDIGSAPMLVVGGPCVNTVAAELMGNPANCAEGFEPGKGIIKLFPDQDALLVAGYSGDDTRAAAQVLANYDQYASQLAGKTEVQVITADKTVTDVTTSGEEGEEQ